MEDTAESRSSEKDSIVQTMEEEETRGTSASLMSHDNSILSNIHCYIVLITNCLSFCLLLSP